MSDKAVRRTTRLRPSVEITSPGALCAQFPDSIACLICEKSAQKLGAAAWPFPCNTAGVTPRIPSSASYQEHWPSILSHSRSTQQRSEPSESEFGQTFRDQLSSNDETVAPAKSVPTSAEHRANPESRDQTHPSSKQVSDKPQQPIAEPASKNAVTTKTAAPPVKLDEAKTSSETKTSGNAASNTGRETRKASSRTRPESSDSQPEPAELQPNGLQIAPVMADKDDGEQSQADTGSEKHEIEESKPVAATGSSGSNAVQGDLALAMRISSTNSDSSQPEEQSETPEAEGMAASLRHNQTQAADGADPQQRHEPDTTTRSAGTIPSPQTGVLKQTEKTAQIEESKSTPSADFEAEFNKFRSEPVRGAHVQITGAENQLVDIRLQERAGTLSVTVRSNDSTLTRTLQDHSPELNSRLSAEHFRTELWTPGLNKTQQERSSNSNSGQGNPQGDAQREQGKGRKGRQNQRPEWIAELENDPAAFHKRIEYTWHQ